MNLEENKIPEEFKKFAKDFGDNGFITTSFENLVKEYESLIVRKIGSAGNGLLKEIVADLDSLDSIRCFFTVLFLARDQKVELSQIDDDIQITLINDGTKKETKYDQNSK